MKPKCLTMFNNITSSHSLITYRYYPFICWRRRISQLEACASGQNIFTGQTNVACKSCFQSRLGPALRLKVKQTRNLSIASLLLIFSFIYAILFFFRSFLFLPLCKRYCITRRVTDDERISPPILFLCFLYLDTSISFVIYDCVFASLMFNKINIKLGEHQECIPTCKCHL